MKVEISLEQLESLKRIRNYFAENDKTQFEHSAHFTLDKIIKEAESKTAKMKVLRIGGSIPKNTGLNPAPSVSRENSERYKKFIANVQDMEKIGFEFSYGNYFHLEKSSFNSIEELKDNAMEFIKHYGRVEIQVVNKNVKARHENIGISSSGICFIGHKKSSNEELFNLLEL